MVAATCNADVMDICFRNMVSGHYKTTDIWYNGASKAGSYYAGLMHYEIGDVTDGSPFEYLQNSFLDTFCVDILEGAQQNTWYYGVEIKQLKDLPIGGGGTPMGQYRAELISALYFEHFGEWESDGDEARKAAAFQIAIWEFAFEYYGDGSGIDFDADDFDDSGFDPKDGGGGAGDYGFFVS